MTTAVPDILARIVGHKRAELARQNDRLADLEKRGLDRVKDRRDFRTALISKPVAIIAECKKASPSKGLIAVGYDPVKQVRAYEDGGAIAVSVLTDAEFFRGSLNDLVAARSAVSLPALRKDFTISRYHVAEAAAHDADAILLIAAILSDSELRELRDYAEEFDLAALVEVHDENELERAVGSGARLIGVNNRNLRTFEVTLETSLRLANRIPAGVLRVSESGIRTRRDIQLLQEAGYQSFLIGERLMDSGDPRGMLRELGA
jgi:indole-3-glycerol phosphate synthase